MVYCVLISSIGSFSNRWVTGYPNVPGEVTHACINGVSHVANNIFPDCLPMSSVLWGFAVVLFCVGGLIGGLLYFSYKNSDLVFRPRFALFLYLKSLFTFLTIAFMLKLYTVINFGV